ncbi:rCG34981 [Rattus norvegicus]|uniref:RCG34981 n=1 Tax=Rattus norvegicus TaxID=10116 RepID=A6HE79_RAT|nr:rCG34981 [Rattus norvegicus]
MSSPSGGKATSLQADPRSPLARRRGDLKSPGMGGKGPWGATSLHPGGEWASESRSAGAGLNPELCLC